MDSFYIWLSISLACSEDTGFSLTYACNGTRVDCEAIGLFLPGMYDEYRRHV